MSPPQPVPPKGRAGAVASADEAARTVSFGRPPRTTRRGRRWKTSPPFDEAVQTAVRGPGGEGRAGAVLEDIDARNYSGNFELQLSKLRQV